MCLVALAIDQHPRFPLVLVSNRDEFFDRPAAPLDWWQPAGQAPVLSGRDLSGGGTWLGLSAAGRLALLTNVRAPGAVRPEAPSRGSIVLGWLSGRSAAAEFCATHQARPYSGFNAITADLTRGDWQWFSNHPAARRALGPGLWGLSNAALETPWPKVQGLKAAVRQALHEAATVDALTTTLLDALADRTPAPVAEVPDTGIPREREHLLSPRFIHIPAALFGRAYGTRCSTVWVSERRAGRLVTHGVERSFDAHGRPSGEVRFSMP